MALEALLEELGMERLASFLGEVRSDVRSR